MKLDVHHVNLLSSGREVITVFPEREGGGQGPQSRVAKRDVALIDITFGIP